MNKKSKGYSWDKQLKKWTVYITVNKKHVWLGYFIKKQDAKKARKEAERKYFGEYAYNHNN